MTVKMKGRSAIPGVPAFTPATGLLGMDQVDAIQADPVKSADGARAYLAKRV